MTQYIAPKLAQSHIGSRSVAENYTQVVDLEALRYVIFGIVTGNVLFSQLLRGSDKPPITNIPPP